MPNGIRTTHHQPSPFAIAGVAVNLDNYGSVWGTDSIQATEALIAEERAAGTQVDEWETTDLDGQPMRIVRLADPGFLDTICVIVGARRAAVPA